MVNKVEESFVKKAREIMSVPAEERKKAKIEKAKSSMPDLVSLNAGTIHLKEREFKTTSTGAIFWKEPYIDYNEFLVKIVHMLYGFGDENTWHPEGKLVYKVDEAINEVSIREEATRAPVVYMKDMSEHLTKIMQRQSPQGSGFFGKMVDAFMRRLLSQPLIEKIRTELWKEIEDKGLFESTSNLGLAKKTRQQAQSKDAIDNLSAFVDLGLPSGTLWAKCNVGADSEEEYGDYFSGYSPLYCWPGEKIKESAGEIPSISDIYEIVHYCNLSEEYVNGKLCLKVTSPKNGSYVVFPFAGERYFDGNLYSSSICGKYICGKNEIWYFFQDRDIKCSNPKVRTYYSCRLVIRKKKRKDKIEESVNLGLAKKTRQQAQDKDDIDTVSYIQFEDPEVERICHEHDVFTYSDAAQVTSIDDWFTKNVKIESFNEFKYFTKLRSVEKYAFFECGFKSIVIPDSVTSIEEYAFCSCYSLQSITIPNSVTSIEAGAFKYCGCIQSVNIPDSVTNIGTCAFHWCSYLQSITIPNSVTSIGDNVFKYNDSLETIYISKNCPVYNKIKEEFPNIQLVEPNVNESNTNLGLAKKARQQAQDKDAIECFSDFVDLDLPSGNLWARKNLNAKTETDVGDYLDFNAVRDLVQDKRYVPEGVPSPPTGEDFDELIDYCTTEYTVYQGKRGWMFTSPTNGERIFFPFGGTKPGDIDYSGWYWSAKEINNEGKFLWMNNLHCSVGYTDKSGEHNVRLVLRKYQVDLEMHESSSNLGLAKKTRVQAQSKDAIDTLSPFVDLGLPSGTLWSKFNLNSTSETDEGEEYTFNDALAAVKDQFNRAEIPNDNDIEELKKYCKYKWTEDGMIFTSKKNGNQILIPKSRSSLGEDEWAWIWTSANSIRETHRWVLCLFNPKFNSSLINGPYLDEASIENTFCVRPVIHKKRDFDFDTKAS